MCHRRGGGARKTPGHAMQLKRLRIIAIVREDCHRGNQCKLWPWVAMRQTPGGQQQHPHQAEGPVFMIWCVQREASHRIVVCFSWRHQQQQRPHYKSQLLNSLSSCVWPFFRHPTPTHTTDARGQSLKCKSRSSAHIFVGVHFYWTDFLEHHIIRRPCGLYRTCGRISGRRFYSTN